MRVGEEETEEERERRVVTEMCLLHNTSNSQPTVINTVIISPVHFCEFAEMYA